MKGVEPTSYQDALALLHDIEYLGGGEKINSDLKAAGNAGWTSLQGIAMNIGLRTRVYVDQFLHNIGFSWHLNGRSDNKVDRIPTKMLQRILLTKAAPILRKWGIEPKLTIG